MRLEDFILNNIEAILKDWEDFARSIWPADSHVGPEELRDHAEAILLATVSDMRSGQSALQQAEKSMGRGDDSPHSRGLDDASVRHGIDRVDSGFKMKGLIAEYRALRASVIRLWLRSKPDPHARDLDDVTRFHESIDQSLATAVASFTDRVEDSRRLFLAILGHDLRNPLNAIAMSAQVLEHEHGGNHDLLETAGRITASAEAMGGMIGDLLDFTTLDLRGAIPLSRKEVDLDAICRDVAQEAQAASPQCSIACDKAGDVCGRWDPRRLRQVVSNLLGNAVQHGGSTCRIDVRLRGEEDQVVLEVHNDGDPIPREALSTIFDPFRRARDCGSPGLGLGLYIARQIVTLHGGTIDVATTENEGTTFTVRLNRTPAGVPADQPA